jgi:hypothetical protein
MKLDGTVCRGSLIIHKGETYVVLAVGYGSTKALHETERKARKITPTPKDGKWHILSMRYIDEGADVDTFFGGAVFEIPDYIR